MGQGDEQAEAADQREVQPGDAPVALRCHGAYGEPLGEGEVGQEQEPAEDHGVDHVEPGEGHRASARRCLGVHVGRVWGYVSFAIRM